MVYCCVWNDPDFRRLGPLEQRLALYVLTSDQGNRVGCFKFSVGKAAEDLDTVSDTVSGMLDTVCDTLKWKWDTVFKVLFLPSWWKWNPPANMSALKGALVDLYEVPESPLKSEFARNVKFLKGDFADTVCHTVSDTVAHQEHLQEHEHLQEQVSPAASGKGIESKISEYIGNHKLLTFSPKVLAIAVRLHALVGWDGMVRAIGAAVAAGAGEPFSYAWTIATSAQAKAAVREESKPKRLTKAVVYHDV